MASKDAAAAMRGVKAADPLNAVDHSIADAMADDPDERAALISQWEVWAQDRVKMMAGPGMGG
jgi:hypothetical protein